MPCPSGSPTPWLPISVACPPLASGTVRGVLEDRPHDERDRIVAVVEMAERAVRRRVGDDAHIQHAGDREDRAEPPAEPSAAMQPGQQPGQGQPVEAEGDAELQRFEPYRRAQQGAVVQEHPRRGHRDEAEHQGRVDQQRPVPVSQPDTPGKGGNHNVLRIGEPRGLRHWARAVSAHPHRGFIRRVGDHDLPGTAVPRKAGNLPVRPAPGHP
jgi:hypothetical protein